MDGDAPIYLRGTPVSPGLARGPLVVLTDESQRRSQHTDDPGDESNWLRTAIAAASADLAAVMEQLEESEAHAIIAFQVAVLADPVVGGPAFAAIAAGAAAEEAWWSAMDLQIREYHEADDLYF